MKEQVLQIIQESVEAKQAMRSDERLLGQLDEVCTELVRIFRNKGKLLICGNGGSAADAQHIAAEFTGKYLADRPPLFAEALTVNSSYLTAVANDYHYDDVFSRMVRAKGREGDMLLCISTSGNSPNVVNAAKEAGALGMKTVAFTGQSDSDLSALCNWTLRIPTDKTPRVQECHILLGHLLCELTEAELFGPQA